jgi:hypothetical protein
VLEPKKAPARRDVSEFTAPTYKKKAIPSVCCQMMNFTISAIDIFSYKII